MLQCVWKLTEEWINVRWSTKQNCIKIETELYSNLKSKHYSAKRVSTKLCDTRCQASTKSIIYPTHTRREPKDQGTPRSSPRRVVLVQAREQLSDDTNLHRVDFQLPRD